MVLPSKLESAAIRFAPHIEELHELFVKHRLRFGSPEDVLPFIEILEAPGALRDQLASRIRSIIYREPDGMARGELLRLIAIAIGGPAVEVAAQEIDEPFPRLFGFVNEALRAPKDADPQEVSASELATDVPLTVLTASDKPSESAYSAPIPAPSVEHVYAAAERNLNSSPEQEPAAKSPGTLPDVPKALGCEIPDPLRVRHEPVRRSLVPSVVLVVVAILVLVAYVARPGLERMKPARHHAPAGILEQDGTTALNRCVSSPGTRVDRQPLFDRYSAAHNLLDQKMFDAALFELRSIATADPAFPGINLDISDSLLQSKRAEEAKHAIDSQLAISDCLSKLPSEAITSYCSVEYPPSIRGNCRTQVVQIQQAAHVEAAMVHLELGHLADSASSTNDITIYPAASPGSDDPDPLAPTTKTPRVASQASRSLVARVPARRVPAAKRPTPHNLPDDKSLMEGSGTDAALGAYSRP